MLAFCIFDTQVREVKDSSIEKQYTRTGNDLSVNLRITLEESLLGFQRDLRLLDGRVLSITQTDVVTPHGHVIVKAGEGMPLKGDRLGRKGNLMINIEVDFPRRLSESARQMIEQLL